MRKDPTRNKYGSLKRGLISSLPLRREVVFDVDYFATCSPQDRKLLMWELRYIERCGIIKRVTTGGRGIGAKPTTYQRV